MNSFLEGFSNFFFEPSNLYWLVALIPLIIFYLIKSRPKKLNLPTTQFLFKDGKVSNFTSMFSKFKFDPLLLIQFLALLILILSISRPFIEVNKDLTTGHTVFIIDNSASMLIGDGSEFDKMIISAIDNLGDENSVVTTSPFARVIANHVSPEKAKGIIKSIKPSHSVSNYKDAINFGTQLIKEKKSSRILVLGDLVDSNFDLDYNTYKNSLEAKQYNIDFIKNNKRGENVGIIDLEFDEDSTTVVIKNFNTRPKEVTLKIENLEHEMKLSDESIETFTYKNLKNDHIIEILEEDDFSIDNKVFISGQKVDKIKVLLVSNNPSTFLKKALEVNKAIQLQLSEPPVIPNFNDFHIIIFENVNNEFIIKSKIEELNAAVKKGKSLIIIPNGNANEINYDNLLNEEIEPITEGNELISVSSPISFMKSIEFGNIVNPYNIVKNDNSIIMASTVTTPVITLNQLGSGSVVYFGINATNSDFKYSYQYPIFFKRLINFLSGKEALENLNFKSGKRLPFKGEVKIKTTAGEKILKDPTFDRVGFYTINDKKIAINLLDEKESDIVTRINFDGSQSDIVSTKYVKKLPEELFWYSLIAFIVLILTEMIIIKGRGDL